MSKSARQGQIGHCLMVIYIAAHVQVSWCTCMEMLVLTDRKRWKPSPVLSSLI